MQAVHSYSYVVSRAYPFNLGANLGATQRTISIKALLNNRLNLWYESSSGTSSFQVIEGSGKP